MTRHRYFVFFVLMFGGSGRTAFASVYDNRYFPWHERPFFRTAEKRSHVDVEGIFFTGDKAQSDGSDALSIPDLMGKFDQNNLADAMVLAGHANPLPTVWRGTPIPWKVDGKITGQGVGLRWEQHLGKRFSFGLSVPFVHVSTRFEYTLTDEAISNINSTRADPEPDRIRRSMNTTLGLAGNIWSRTGVGDLDLFVRYGLVDEYKIMCRRLDLGVQAGVLAPTGTKRDLDNQNSFALGGNGHWGYYVNTLLQVELKEDMFIGGMAQIVGRSSNIQRHRMPVKNEPMPYGAVRGDAQVSPGSTVVLSAFGALQDMQEGLGVFLRYTVARHASDTWFDRRADRSVATTLGAHNNSNGVRDRKFFINQDSSWISEYATVRVEYDFSRVHHDASHAPKVYVGWDIPVRIFAGRDFAKTHRVTAGIEVGF